MKQITTAIACLACCILASLVQADDKKAMVDPSGTWRWNFEINGDSIENVLKLDIDKDGKLTGTLEARGIKMNVQQGKVSGNEVSFQVEVELEQTIKLANGFVVGLKDVPSLYGDRTAEGSRT